MNRSLALVAWCWLTSAKHRFEVFSDDAAFYGTMRRINGWVSFARYAGLLSIALSSLFLLYQSPGNFWWLLPVSTSLLVGGVGLLGGMPASQESKDELGSAWPGGADDLCAREYRHQVWQVEMLLWRLSPEACSVLQAQAIASETVASKQVETSRPRL